MVTYSEKLKSPKWQRKRLEIFNRDNFTCTKCGDTERQLQVHHLKYTGEPYDAPNENLITVCEYCHFVIEDLKTITSENYHSIYKTRHSRIAESELHLRLYCINDKIEYYITFLKSSDTIEMLYNLSNKKNGRK